MFSNFLFSDDKVLVFTYSYNRPDFIEIHYNTFKKFLKDEYEFVAFNDATDPAMYRQIRQTCQSLGITCIDIPQEIHVWNNPSSRNGAVVDYSLRVLGYQHKGFVALLDSDLFLVKEFSIKEFMQDSPLGGLYQARAKDKELIDYLWVGIVFLDMANLPDSDTIQFSPTNVRGTQLDTGGLTHHYLAAHRKVPVTYFNQFYNRVAFELMQAPCEKCANTGQTPCEHAIQRAKDYGKFDDNQIKYIIASGPNDAEFYIDSHFIHYRGGTNWDGQSDAHHRRKTQTFTDYIHTILNQ
jgi:hypothetical protein